MSIINEKALREDIILTMVDSLGVEQEKAEKLTDRHLDSVINAMYDAITDEIMNIETEQ